MRRHLTIACDGVTLAATLDAASAPRAGLLIVGGGNEPRAGPQASHARLAARLAARGVTTLRYDRRGVGDSEGVNAGYRHAEAEIIASLERLRDEVGPVPIVALGTCDGASALLLHNPPGVAGRLLVNPWAIEDEQPAANALPPPAAIRLRYLQRLREPGAVRALVTGGVDLRRLARGLRAAMSPAPPPTPLGQTLIAALTALDAPPTTILLSAGDRTAQHFAAMWSSRTAPGVTLSLRPTASHALTGPGDADWLSDQALDLIAAVSGQAAASSATCSTNSRSER